MFQWLKSALVFIFDRENWRFWKGLRQRTAAGELLPLTYEELRDHGTCNRGVHFMLDWPEKGLKFSFLLPEQLCKYLEEKRYYCPGLNPLGDGTRS